MLLHYLLKYLLGEIAVAIVVIYYIVKNLECLVLESFKF